MNSYVNLEVNDGKSAELTDLRIKRILGCILIWVLILTLVTSFIVIIAMITTTQPINETICIVSNNIGINLLYPDETSMEYIVNFNTSINQPNWVYYISTSGNNSCACSYFRNDPYGVDPLKNDDYTDSGYDRGHLVPNADYGYDTYIITNAVPMNPKFNQGIWLNSEENIRSSYSGNQVYKGCDYSMNTYIITSLNHTLYIPIGCYYIVLDSNNNLLDNGYYVNSYVSIKEDKLPYWINCN
jgi:DNA/RNA endonuclease G (NUC1)